MDRAPIRKRAGGFADIVQWGGGSTRTLQRQEAVRQEAQRRMVMKAWPRATLAARTRCKSPPSAFPWDVMWWAAITQPLRFTGWTC